MRCRPSVLPLAAALAAAAVAAHASPVLPSENQMSLLDWDMTAFVHFSITTFTGSQTGTQDPTKFAPNPTTLNVSQWVSSVKAMGAPVAVLTSKHEAGFCLWPTNTSSRNFSIAASPTVGQRDLIREFTTECRKQGIMPGLYFTPTDPYTVDVLGHAQGSEANNAVQLAQMEELTSNYGELAYIWFDHYCQHAGKQHPQWVCPLNGTFKGLAEIVRRNQPQAVILGQDTKQVGAEGGYAPYPLYYQCDTRLNTSISNCVDSQSGRDIQGKNIGMNGSPTGRFWKSPESDCSIYDGCHPWFASDSAPVQSVATAIQHFELTVVRPALESFMCYCKQP
jgi:alpha-L-fucosidase